MVKEILSLFQTIEISLSQAQCQFLASRCSTAESALSYFFSHQELVENVENVSVPPAPTLPPPTPRVVEYQGYSTIPPTPVAVNVMAVPPMAVIQSLAPPPQSVQTPIQVPVNPPQYQDNITQPIISNSPTPYSNLNPYSVPTMTESSASIEPVDLNDLTPFQVQIHNLLQESAIFLTTVQIQFLSARVSTLEAAINYYFDNQTKVLEAVQVPPVRTITVMQILPIFLPILPKKKLPIAKFC